MKLDEIKNYIRNLPYQSRAESFLKLFDNIYKRFGDKPIIMLETGTTRGKNINDINGGGGSTIVFGKWCELTNSKLITVDINSESINDCKNSTKQFSNHIEYIEQDSVAYLRNFEKPVDFLYLDSMDTSDYNKNIIEEACRHQLKEIQNIIFNLHENSLILLDDIKNSEFKGGKSEYSIPFLLACGYKPIYYHPTCCQLLLGK
jgi:hypothetical protein